MVVSIDKDSGFCFGVTRAISMAEDELQSGRLFCLGDIVHNGQEVERLSAIGLETIDYDDLRTLHGVRVLFRAHGEPPSTYQIAEQNTITVIDASCPVVLHLQKRIRETYLQTRTQQPTPQIVIFGKIGHAEVIGLQGQTNNTAIVIESADDLGCLDYSRPIYLFSQTTKSIDEFHTIVDLIRAKIPSDGTFEWHDTICRNVANRVERLQRFAREHDVVIFVGGKKSSNAKVLFQNCQKVNPRTIFVSSEGELTPAILSDCHSAERVGICGATSTPQWLMERCKAVIEKDCK